MKNFIRIMSLALIFILCGTAALADTPTATAYKTQTAVTIDGSLTEWTLDSPIVIDQPEQVIRDEVMWNGLTDASLSTYIMWDEDNLYLAADVMEDSPFGAIEMLPLDGEDNLKLYISTDPTADPDRTAFGSNDFLVFLVMDNQYWDTAIDRSMVPKDARERFISKGMDGGANVLEGYECAAMPTATGFIFEAKIPWAVFSNSNIPVYSPVSGDQVKFNFAITDISYPCPGTEYIPQLAWAGNLLINSDPSLWGTLVFE